VNVPGSQRGVALLIVLVVVALATTLAASLLRDRQLALRRAGNLVYGDQALVYAEGAETWARTLLLRDARANRVDSLGDGWQVGLPPTPVPGGSLSGRLRDLQGRFNVNNLQRGAVQDALARDRFARLLRELNLQAVLLPALADWIDPDVQPQAGGAEDDSYSRLAVPYRAANQPLVDVSELRLVSGVDSAAYTALMPHVTTLPEATAINLNTADAVVLRALGLNPRQAQALVARRREQPFDSVAEALALPELQGSELDKQRLAVSSRFFELEIEVVVADLHYVQYSVLRRDGTQGVTVLSRRRRGW